MKEMFCQKLRFPDGLIKTFLKGCDSTENEPRSRRTSTAISDESVRRIRDLARSDCWLTIRMIEEQLNMTKILVYELRRRRKTFSEIKRSPGEKYGLIFYGGLECVVISLAQGPT
ncbi:hypothetical protein Trydic_g19114 [Trypoxylus dichotomus]